MFVTLGVSDLRLASLAFCTDGAYPLRLPAAPSEVMTMPSKIPGGTPSMAEGRIRFSRHPVVLRVRAAMTMTMTLVLSALFYLQKRYIELQQASE